MPHEVTGNKYHMKQKIDWIEAISEGLGYGCCSMANRYAIMDEKKEVAYTAIEEANCCCRCCCRPIHPFQLKVYEGKFSQGNQAVMTMYHPCKSPPCCPILCDCQRGEMIVYDGDIDALNGDKGCKIPSTCGSLPEGQEGNIISVVKQPACGGWFTPTVQVFDGYPGDGGKATFTAKGPTCCIGGICGNICFPAQFDIHSGDGENEDNVAELKQVYPDGAGDVCQQLFTDADNFDINMPPGATNATKAAILGTALLLDYLFFEEGADIQIGFSPKGNLEVMCVCFNFYCCGALCPCTCTFGGDGADDGASG